MQRALVVVFAFIVACGGRTVDDQTDAGKDAAATVDASDAKPSPFDATVSCSKTCQGCCDQQGVCHDGKEASSCGKSAQACVDCTAQGLVCAASTSDGGGGTCASGKPVTCTPQNCAGCCEGNYCRPGSALDACGVSGDACIACPLGAACASGACVADASACSSSNCLGCCIGATCYIGTDNSQCGAGGQKCDNCYGKGGCSRTGAIAGGVCTTSAGCSCTTGCCDDFYQCHTGDDALACGGGGSSCGVCENGGTCTSNACTLGTCNAQNCSGCCDDFGVCRTSTDLDHCGHHGDHCATCPSSGYACNGGECIVAPTCNAQNCSGCCDLNNECTQGIFNNACGSGGTACVACNNGDQCLQQKCQ
jgi:hypothetical protein